MNSLRQVKEKEMQLPRKKILTKWQRQTKHLHTLAGKHTAVMRSQRDYSPLIYL